MIDKEWVKISKERNTQAFVQQFNREPISYDEVLAWVKGLDTCKVARNTYESNVYMANAKAIEVIQYD